MAFCAWTMPWLRSLASSSALPPVSAASDQSVSWVRCRVEMAVIAVAPEYAPIPPGDARVASPMGACAIRPRASTVKNETPARVAALMGALQGGNGCHCGGAGVRADSARRCTGGVAHGGLRDQAARVHREEDRKTVVEGKR